MKKAKLSLVAVIAILSMSFTIAEKKNLFNKKFDSVLGCYTATPTRIVCTGNPSFPTAPSASNPVTTSVCVTGAPAGGSNYDDVTRDATCTSTNAICCYEITQFTNPQTCCTDGTQSNYKVTRVFFKP